MSGTRGKENKMINIRKKKDVIAEMNEHTECAYSMMDSIAKMTAIDFDDSGAFGYDSPHTVLFCDLIFKLYSRAEYKEAMALMAVAFMMVGMDDSSHLMGVAASGYTEDVSLSVYYCVSPL